MSTPLVTLPRAQSSLVDPNGKPTREFYRWFQSVVNGIEGQIGDLSAVVQGLVNISDSLGSADGQTTDIINVVAALAEKVDITRIVTGGFSLTGGGPLSADVALSLVGDLQFPGQQMMYGTDADGNRGWQPQGIPSFVTTDDVPEGSTNLYFTDARVYDASKVQLAAGANITITPNDGADTLTIAAPGSGTGGVLPLVTGEIASGQPVFVYLDDGELVYAEAA